MIRLNLLPDIKREYLKARRTEAKAISFSILLGLMAIIGVIMIGVYVYVVQQVQTGLLTDSIKNNTKTLEAEKDVDKYLTLQSQLANIDTLHQAKTNYSRLLDILPRLNPAAPNNVDITEITIDSTTSVISLSGNANDYTGLITYRDTIRNTKLTYITKGQKDQNTEDMFPVVTIGQSSISKGSDGVSKLPFKITATFNKNAFATNSTNVNVVVPNKDTTPSRVGSPDSTATTTGGTQ